jgi:glycolate oxidase
LPGGPLAERLGPQGIDKAQGFPYSLSRAPGYSGGIRLPAGKNKEIAMITPEVKHKIRSIVGPENALDGEIDRFGYSYDSSFVPLSADNRPDLVVRPLTTEEVSRVMAVAGQHGIPVTPRGAASGRTGGSIPLQGGISLALDRMTRIIELDEGNMMVRAEAGVRTIDLYDHCAARGLFFPPDPASWKFSTIGGNVAENAGGMRAVKYGVTANYVMGLQVVLADGTILETGGKALKNVTGYDLKSLFTGSEGTLGIVTQALLRLIPMPKQRGTIQIMFRALDDGCATVLRRKRHEGGVVGVAESVDLAVEACLVIEIDGENDAALADQARRIEELAGACGAVAFRVAQSQQESDELWAVRRGISSAVAGLAPNRLGEDISVPRDAFPEVVRRIRAISERHRLPIAVYGHAGDGNIHPSVLCDLSDPEEAERVHRAVDEIFAAALAVGGTLSGEHGIGITKRPYIVQALGETGVQTLRALKQALDPKGILNPGKIW